MDNLNNKNQELDNLDLERNDSDDLALKYSEGEINKIKHTSMPANENFKNDLKNNFLNKEKSSRMEKIKSEVSFFKKIFKPKYITPLVAIILIVSVVFGSINLLPLLKSSKITSGPNIDKAIDGFSKLLITPAYAKDNFELTPTKKDSLGVDNDSAYILKSKEELDIEVVKRNIVVQPEIEYDVKEISKKEWEIIPKEPIEPNTLLKISLVASYESESGEEKDRDFSWVYQVKDTFKVIHSIPAHAGVSVPLNSGIEITFSHDNFFDFEKYFELTPKTEGFFEVHKRTLVFVPKNQLSPGTIYKVKMGKGMPLKDSDEVLAEDYEFTFETVVDSSLRYSREYFSFSSKFIELAPDEDPLISISGYRAPQGEIEFKVSKFNSFEDFSGEVQKMDKFPWWSYSKEGYKIDSSKLVNVFTFNQEIKVKNGDRFNGGVKYIELPSRLKIGSYLIEGSLGGNYVWAFLQVSNISTYLNVTNTNTIIWTNSVATGQAIRNARIDILGMGKSFITNESGVSEFETPDEIKKVDYKKNLTYYYKIKDGDDVLLSPASQIFRDYWWYPNENFDYWNYLYTDRPRYQSTDVIKFWGLLKMRDGDKIADKVTVSLNKQGYRDYYYRPISIVQKEIELSGDSTYEGEFDLRNLVPDYYTLDLKIGDKVIRSQYININPYIKPAYNLELSADKKYAFAGETITLTGKASFFEGTPVPQLDLILKVANEDKKLKTDENGEIKYQYTLKYSDCSGGYYCWPKYEYFTVRPEKSELGEITADVSVRFYGPKVYLDVDRTYPEKGKALVKIKSKYIDLNQIENGDWWESGQGEEIAGNTRIEAKLTKTTYTKVETGTKYDFINKKSYETYRYDKKVENLDNIKVNTDINGDYVYERNIDPETSYKLEIKYFDREGKSGVQTIYLYYYDGYIQKQYGGYGYDYYHLQLEDDKTYKLGETVEVRFMNGEEPMPTDKGKYLFLQLQNGLQEYNIQNSNEIK